MARVLAIANSKGGVGKSTLATNLAAHAAGEDQRVLLIDTDPQASSTVFAATRPEERPQFRVIQLTKPILHREVPQLAEPFDLVILDTGARENATFRSAMSAAATLLIPVTPSAYDIWASEDVFTAIDEIAAIRDVDVRIVLNQVIPNTRVAREALDALAELADDQGARLLDTRVHSRVAWKMASSRGLSVAELKPKSPAADELRALYAELAL